MLAFVEIVFGWVGKGQAHAAVAHIGAAGQRGGKRQQRNGRERARNWLAVGMANGHRTFVSRQCCDCLKRDDFSSTRTSDLLSCYSMLHSVKTVLIFVLSR